MPVKELVVISGKGGTGKTSVTASFAALAENAVLVDCDVDAADLHLVTAPRVTHRDTFSGGSEARILEDRCYACGRCIELCRFEAITKDGPGNAAVDATYRIDPAACEGCGVCARFCPAKAIDFGPAINGHWFISETRFGPMVHAKLGIAAENSGKLVSFVRGKARHIAEEQGKDLVLIDGPPGIGCPVIASLTGSAFVLIITEPTLSGEHDLERVLSLTSHFGIPAAVCINKWDLNSEMAAQIEQKATERGATVAGRISYDRSVTDAQVQGKATVEYGGPAAQDIRTVWQNLQEIGKQHGIPV